MRVAGEVTNSPRGHIGKDCSSAGLQTKGFRITVFQSEIEFEWFAFSPVCCVSLEVLTAASLYRNYFTYFSNNFPNH